jgi:hypothetical protein
MDHSPLALSPSLTFEFPTPEDAQEFFDSVRAYTEVALNLRFVRVDNVAHHMILRRFARRLRGKEVTT